MNVQDKEFSLPIRVYIEDTDAGGIVYYVNYLKFLERARTEFMRALGFDKQAIFNQGLMFVVRDVSLSYQKPAQLDDQLVATVNVCRVGGASMELHQRVLRGTELLAGGEVKIACVDPAQLNARRMPKDMLAKLRAFLS
ncbi:MAG: tol-pal system-associated acyl-CoA thioesterase [Pseudomonadota bacterium]